MNLTHIAISFGLGFLIAALLWIRAFRRVDRLVRFYTNSANLLSSENHDLRAKNEQLRSALDRRDRLLRIETGAPSTIQALVLRQIISPKN